MRSREPLTFLIAVVSSLAYAAPASACSITNLVLDKSAGPGDTVSYSISGIEPNSTYSFTIAGQTVSGTNDGSPGLTRAAATTESAERSRCRTSGASS